jgi:hypothetical protein
MAARKRRVISLFYVEAIGPGGTSATAATRAFTIR